MEGAVPRRAMWVLLLCAVCSVQASEGEEETVIGRRAVAITYDPNCDPVYKSISSEHTMCMVDVGTGVPLTQAEKDALLQKHNELRKGVSPLAADMMKVYWDDSLAMQAGKWARQCILGHDTSTQRKVPVLPGIYVGQNLYYSSPSLADPVAAVASWYKEVVDFKFGTGSINGKQIGHYTQIVNADSQRIGCGKAYCSIPYTNTYFLVCNYAIGQYSSDLQTPYKNSSQSCSSCSGSCNSSGKLCDCSGKLCLNGGTLDIKTCACQCNAPLYSGDTCKTLNCPVVDAWYCGNQLPASHCTTYSNVPYECPYMCGVCKSECGTKVCQNGGTLDYQTCTCSCTSLYSGDTCQTANCPATDASYCATQGGSWPQSYCTQYSNVPYECPYMCGLCP